MQSLSLARGGLVSSQSHAASEGRCSLSAQASNIDDVLGHHTSFLDSCLKDCMLTNPELLRVFSRLMSVCVMFTSCMQVCHPPRAGLCPRALPHRRGPGPAAAAAPSSALCGAPGVFLCSCSYSIQLRVAASESVGRWRG